MDEPCSALDPIATLKIEELIARAQAALHDRHRHPQHAAGGARRRQDRVHARAASCRVRRRPTRSSPTRTTSARRTTSPASSGRRRGRDAAHALPRGAAQGSRSRRSARSTWSSATLDRTLEALAAPGHRARLDRHRRRRPHRRPLPRGPPGHPLPARHSRRRWPPTCALVAALLHVIKHVERMGDQCVNIAKLLPHRRPRAAGRRARCSPPSMRMGELARSEVAPGQAGLRAPRRRPRRGPRAPGRGDQQAQPRRLPHGGRRSATDADRREWAMTMMLVARALERIGDNAVDIGEQVAFVRTGLFREFSDASHPLPS